MTGTSAVVFGAVTGVLCLSTVPLTSGLVAATYGSRYLSSLFGLGFLSHQVGAVPGWWLGGRVFDSTGSWDPVWAPAVMLGQIAAAIHIPIAAGDDRSPAPSMAS